MSLFYDIIEPVHDAGTDSEPYQQLFIVDETWDDDDMLGCPRGPRESPAKR